MQNFQLLIYQLSKGTNLHISVLDLAGILNTPLTTIEFKNVIHSKQFCNVAKSTEKGHHACLLCKLMANTKAVRTKKSYVGHCVYGLCEGAFPVIIDNVCVAIVYVGNAIRNKDTTTNIIKTICAKTGVEQEELYRQLDNCEKIEDEHELLQIAEVVADYLVLLYKNTPKNSQELHWLVSIMKNHAEQQFFEQTTLRELALTYRHNAKYLGRLFRTQIGVSFNEYCNNLRLAKAEDLLKYTDKKIIDIAMDTGFFNVSYFNRTFYKKHGVSPSEYRKHTLQINKTVPR
jgi:YesN/AraC family two-component response regulator